MLGTVPVPKTDAPGLLTMEFHICHTHYSENIVVLTLLSVNFTKSNLFFKNTEQTEINKLTNL